MPAQGQFAKKVPLIYRAETVYSSGEYAMQEINIL
jgi:hypothetical protein